MYLFTSRFSARHVLEKIVRVVGSRSLEVCKVRLQSEPCLDQIYANLRPPIKPGPEVSTLKYWGGARENCFEGGSKIVTNWPEGRAE